MNELDKLIEICNNFKKGKYTVEEFQHRIETVYLPPEYKHTLEIYQYNVSNELEKVIYFYGEPDLAKKIANDFINEINKYKEMKNNK